MLMKQKHIILLLTTLLVACNDSIKTIDTTSQLQDILRQVGASSNVLFGQHDATLYGHSWCGERGRSDCHDITNDYPAVISFDLGHIESGDSVNIDGIPFRLIRQAIIDHHAEGGILSISWHPRNFVTGGASWDTSCDSVVRAILPTGSHHQQFTQALDNIVTFVASLRDQTATPIPVLFRPWHEQNGTWFWWGATGCTPEEYKALYRFTHDYLAARLPQQLLWTYSPNLGINDSTYMLYYPGNEYIDLLGVDCYHFNNETPDTYQYNLCQCLETLTHAGSLTDKPIALTETGLESCQIPDWWTQVLLPVLQQYPLSYVLLWRNAYDNDTHYYVPFLGDTSADDFHAFYLDSHTIFLKQLQRLIENE